MEGPTAVAIDDLARCASSEELLRAVWADQVTALRQRVAEAKVLEPFSIYEVLRQCFALADFVRGDFDDGTAAARGAGLRGDDDEQDDGWEFGVAVAELMAHGLAAVSAVVQEVPGGDTRAILEGLSADLDYFSANIFGGLCQLGVQERQLFEREERLLRALRSICAWALATVGRGVGYDRFSAAVLWEWASGDALWALVLAKGVLSMPPGSAAVGDVPRPSELPDLQVAVLRAVLNLSTPDVAFAFRVTDDQRAITDQNVELARHKADLAAAFVSCQLLHVLCEASENAGARVGPALVAFLTSMLQPQLMAPDLGQHPEAVVTLAEAKRSTGTLSGRIQRYRDILWCFLTEVPAEFGGELPPGFYQDCADLSYYVPPRRFSFDEFACSTLAFKNHDVGTLAVIPIIAANAGIVPSAGVLVDTLTSLPADGKAAILSKWDRWRGPVQLNTFEQWWQLLEAPNSKGVSHPPQPPPEAPIPDPLPAQPEAGPKAALQAAVRDAPAEFCCALDGQLMMDPVRSPQGLVFERAELVHALSTSGGRCPVTGEPLSIEDCLRAADLRRRIARWVREKRPVGCGRRSQIAATAQTK